ncbi:MAG: hypothetical protein QXI16_05605 [Sulfolobaceae archaeon]
MQIIKRSATYFLLSISDKWKAVSEQKLELHVSPFFEFKGQFYWQPVFDFDNIESLTTLTQFLDSYKGLQSPPWYLERSSPIGYHLFCTIAFGPIKKSEIIDLRRRITNRLQSFINLDITSSIRDLPIRRLPSVDSTGTFTMVPLTLDRKDAVKFSKITQYTVFDLVKNFTLPTKRQPLLEFWNYLK